MKRRPARVTEASRQCKLVKEGPRQEKIDQARAQEMRRSGSIVALADNPPRLRHFVFSDGRNGVLSENIEAGEYVTAGTPIVTVAKMDSVWLRAYVDETDLGRVRWARL